MHWRRPHWLHFHHRHPRYLVLVVKVRNGSAVTDSFAVIIPPNRKVTVMEEVTVGHIVDLAIKYLDARGNPMKTTPTPDAPPTWTDTTPATDTLVAAPDGSTAKATTIAPGTDTINMSVVVGGNTYTAALNLVVDDLPQVLTSVAIVATVE
jgi:hypothetical protein